MDALERYLQLKNEEKTDNQIFSLMQEEGFSVSEINDAINHATIKEAMSQAPQTTNDIPVQSNYQVSSSEYSVPEENYYSYQNTSVETTTEIIEQIIAKKIREISNELNNIKKQNVYLEKEIENLKERLKRIEDNFDYLQRALIGKISEFESNTKLIQKDLDNIHGTMSKLMNPLIDNYNETKKLINSIGQTPLKKTKEDANRTTLDLQK